jgi:sulfur carrier protein ThiS
MKITVNLTGSLKGSIPNEVDVPDGITVKELLKLYNIENKIAAFVINHTVGQHHWERVLQDGNEITLLAYSN